jgi:hypothetical protein
VLSLEFQAGIFGLRSRSLSLAKVPAESGGVAIGLWGGSRRRVRAAGAPVESGSPSPRDKDRQRQPENRERDSTVCHCQCCRFSDLLSMTPQLAALDRRGHHRRRRSGRSIVISSPRSPERHRRPEPESANNNSAKKNWRRGPAAAAPPSRPEQVGLRQSSVAARLLDPWSGHSRSTRYLPLPPG